MHFCMLLLAHPYPQWHTLTQRETNQTQDRCTHRTHTLTWSKQPAENREQRANPGIHREDGRGPRRYRCRGGTNDRIGKVSVHHKRSLCSIWEGRGGRRRRKREGQANWAQTRSSCYSLLPYPALGKRPIRDTRGSNVRISFGPILIANNNTGGDQFGVSVIEHFLMVDGPYVQCPLVLATDSHEGTAGLASTAALPDFLVGCY